MFRLGEDMEEVVTNDQYEDRTHRDTSSDYKSLTNCCQNKQFIGVFLAASLVLLLTVGVGIAKVAIGSLYLNECAAQDLIPIWLIVGGVIPLFLNIRPRETSKERKKSCYDICIAIYRPIVSTFCFVWLLCGTVWVLQGLATAGRCSQQPHNVTSVARKLPGNHSVDVCLSCNVFLLKFSFGMLIVEWCLTGVIFIVLVVMVTRLCCIRWHSRAI